MRQHSCEAEHSLHARNSHCTCCRGKSLPQSRIRSLRTSVLMVVSGVALLTFVLKMEAHSLLPWLPFCNDKRYERERRATDA